MSVEKPIICNYINLIFPILGDKIPLDHGYLLYSAISRQFPIIHDLDEFGIYLLLDSLNFLKIFV